MAKDIMDDESRRSFLRRVGRAGIASVVARWLAGGSASHAGESATTLPVLATRPDTGPIDQEAKSFVAHVCRPEVVDRRQLHERLLREMVEDGVCVTTATAKPGDAWNKLFNRDDVIGIKFNQVGFEELGTADVLAAQVVESLGDAGFAPDKIVLIEAPGRLARELKTRPRVFGFSGGEVSFGSGADELAAVLQEVTALINVPFLKTHNIAGMTGCLKNLSHALIRRPARYHANACAPFAGHIVALPQIRSKLRIHIVNAVRALFDGGPAVRVQGIWDHAGILVSKDPVAADAVGVNIINDQRALAKLPPIGDAAGHIPHVHAAAGIGLGTDDQDYIDLQEVPLR